MLSKILSDLAAQIVSLATLLAIAPCGAERTTFLGLAAVRVEAGLLTTILFTLLQLVRCSRYNNHIHLLQVDISVLVTMKNAGNCDTLCELHDFT